MGSGEAARNFATEIQKAIELNDRPEVKGWIVDLRENLGGNMWPMLCGLGPLLGPGVHGFFVDSNNKFVPWTYKDGIVSEGNATWLSIKPYEIKKQPARIAVLVGSKTASSGEAIALSFRGRQNSVLVGSKTFGATSTNKGHKLKDGSLLYLTEGYFADRFKVLHKSGIAPDLVSEEDYQMQRAINWIRNGL